MEKYRQTSCNENKERKLYQRCRPVTPGAAVSSHFPGGYEPAYGRADMAVPHVAFMLRTPREMSATKSTRDLAEEPCTMSAAKFGRALRRKAISNNELLIVFALRIFAIIAITKARLPWIGFFWRVDQRLLLLLPRRICRASNLQPRARRPIASRSGSGKRCPAIW